MNYYLIALADVYLSDGDPVIDAVVIVPDDADSEKVALVTDAGVASGPVQRPDDVLEPLPTESSMLLNYRGKYGVEMQFSDNTFDLAKVARRLVVNAPTYAAPRPDAYPDEEQAVTAARALLGTPLTPSTGGKDQS